MGVGRLGSVGTARLERGEGAPASPQFRPSAGADKGRCAQSPPPLCSAPRARPPPQSCFQFKRSPTSGRCPGGRDRSAERPCNFRGELTGSNTAPRCPDRRPRRPETAPRRPCPGRGERRLGRGLLRGPSPAPARSSTQPNVTGKPARLPHRCCLQVPRTYKNPTPFGRKPVRSTHSWKEYPLRLEAP